MKRLGGRVATLLFYSRGIELMENSTRLISREIYISAGNQQHDGRDPPLGIFRGKSYFCFLHLASGCFSTYVRNIPFRSSDRGLRISKIVLRCLISASD